MSEIMNHRRAMERRRPRTTESLPVGRPPSPSLRFSPTAWAKLLYLRDLGDTEVGGFGIARADDLLWIEEVLLVRQQCTFTSVVFDDQAVADFFDAQVDRGLKPEQFARIWVHTHPGDGAEPSAIDEDTFCRVFGRTHWAAMFILARGGEAYARLRFHVGPGGQIEIPVSVDYRRAFAASDHVAWEEEYQANVCIEPLCPSGLLLMPPPDDPLFEPFGRDTRWPEESWGLFDEPLDEQEPCDGSYH